MKRLTDVHSLTLQVMDVIDEFKEGYEEIFSSLSTELKMPLQVKPAKVILDVVTGHCSIYVLRNPKTPAYKMNDYIFQLARRFKEIYGLSTVILRRENTYVDEDNVPEVLEVNEKDVKEIIKKAQEDDLFSPKYKEYISRKRSLEEAKKKEAEQDAAAYAYAEKMSGKINIKEDSTPDLVEEIDSEEDSPATINPTIVEEPTPAEKEIAEEAVVTQIRFTIEKNGQLCLVF